MPRPGRIQGLALLPAQVLLVLVVVLSMVLAASAQAQSPGTLEGQVVNGTADGPAVGSGILVTLRVYQGETEVDTLETATDAGGRFRFEGLDTDAGLAYWPEAVYLDVPYGSAEPYQFDGDRTTLPATITVFETTDDDSAIGLEAVHLVAESFGEMLRISEIFLFGNSGDRTYVGSPDDTGQVTTVYIPVPDDGVGLAVEQGTSEERFVEAEGGLKDTAPVPPGGETSLVFLSYHLVVGGDTVPLERHFAYPVANLNILAAQPGLTLRSDQMQAMGTEIFQGREYEFYVTQNLAPNTPLAVEFVVVPDAAAGPGVEGMPAGGEKVATRTTAGGNQELLLWLGLGLAALAVVGAVVYALGVRRSPSTVASTPDLTADPKARPLLADLADLQEAFEAGEVDEATYERQRAEIYEALKAL